MAAYNFKSQFVEPIQRGEKTTTIRPCRKRPTRAGDTLYLFTGQRTKACRGIGMYRCKSVTPIAIDTLIGWIYLDQPGLPNLNDAAVEEMAKADGFTDTWQFFEFFRQVYGPDILHMELIAWEPLS